MSADLDAIRERCDLAEIARGYLTLRKSGRNWTGLCPFHQERTPSFSIDAEKGVWHCFGCEAGGDVFAFVERIEQTDFKGALRILSEKAGIEHTAIAASTTPRPGRRPKERKPAQGSRPHTVRKGARIVSDAGNREKPKTPMLTSTQTGGKWRQELKGVVPLAGTPGAAYLESRGVPLDVAEAAGVKYHPGYYGVEAIVFAVRDVDGNLVSAQGRTIKRPWVDKVTGRERTKETAHGTQLTAGAFWTWGARDRSLPIIAITESPLDSLALAAAGLPGFALCGKAVRDWADDFTSWRRVLLAFDATAETESGRPLENWRAALTCGQRVERLCPPVKDWALMAETRGIDAIRAYIEAFLAGPVAAAMCIECGQPGAPWEGATCKACDVWAEE